MVQFANYNTWQKIPQYEKRYKLAKIIRFGTFKRSSNMLCDLEGNFNLMCANPRAMKLLAYLKQKRLK